jgi:hypothetical protein
MDSKECSKITEMVVKPCKKRDDFRWICHKLRKEDGKYQMPPYCGILKEARREEDLRIDGEDRLSKKQVEYISKINHLTEFITSINICYMCWLHCFDSYWVIIRPIYELQK